MIRAFAIRTASVLGDGFFDGAVLVSAAAVGVMRNCVGALEPCSTGCMFMGPGDAGLLLGIMDNARLPGSFRFLEKARGWRTGCAPLHQTRAVGRN